MYNERQSLRIYSPPPRNTLAFSLSSAHLSIYSISLSLEWDGGHPGCGAEFNGTKERTTCSQLEPTICGWFHPFFPQLKCTPLSLSTVILDIYLSFSFHLSIRLLFLVLYIFWGLPPHFFFIPASLTVADLSLYDGGCYTTGAAFNCYRTDALLAFAWKHASIRRATCDGYHLDIRFFYFFIL